MSSDTCASFVHKGKKGKCIMELVDVVVACHHVLYCAVAFLSLMDLTFDM